MKIYRIENVEGDGPYSAKHEYKYELQDAHQSDQLRPGIRTDIPDFNKDVHFYGFQKYGHLISWFDGWLDKLKDQGFKLVKYKVPRKHVIKGTNQLVFEINKAKLLSRREIK